MNGRNQLRLVLRAIVLAALAALAALAVSSGASAEGEVVSIDRITIAPDGQGSVDLEAHDIGAPGLGAWTIDVVYDPDVVTPIACGAQSGSLCNINYKPFLVRVTGAKATGLVGDFQLASITFQCKGIGATALGISLWEFADATQLDPMKINAETVEGAVYCNEQGRPLLLGDVNCDGIVNAIDAALVLQYTAGLIHTLPCFENGDMNGDGVVNAIDAFLILLQ